MIRISRYDVLEKRISQLKSDLLLFKTLEGDPEVNGLSLQHLLDSVPIPFFYKDKNGKYQQCNNAFAKTILGLSKNEIIGKSLYDLAGIIPKENADIYHQKDIEILNSITAQSYETKVQCAGGTEKYYHFYKSNFIVDDQILGVICVMLDISKYRNTMNELDKINAALIEEIDNTNLPK